MSFERDYKDLLAYAKLKVHFLQLSIFPEDLINDAYVNLYGKDYSVQDFRKEISNLAIKEKGQTKKSSTPFKIIELRGDRCCITCKQVKSADEFKISVQKNGSRYLYTECTECVERKLMDRYHAHKDTPEYKARNKKNFKAFVDRDRKKWNSYLKQRDRDDRINLTDSYIKKTLRGKYSKEHLSENPQIIVQQREKIFAKRLAKANKVI